MDIPFEPWGTDGYSFRYKGHLCIAFRSSWASYRFGIVSSKLFKSRNILYVRDDLSSQAELVKVFGPELAARLMGLLYTAEDTNNG